MVKVEPKSPGDLVPSKHKMYLTTNAQLIRHFDSVDVFNSQGSLKHQKTASGVWFDSVMVTKPPQPMPRATKKSMQSSKANSKKSTSELFAQLGKEYQAIVKTCEELLKLFD